MKNKHGKELIPKDWIEMENYVSGLELQVENFNKASEGVLKKNVELEKELARLRAEQGRLIEALVHIEECDRRSAYSPRLIIINKLAKNALANHDLSYQAKRDEGIRAKGRAEGMSNLVSNFGLYVAGFESREAQSLYKWLRAEVSRFSSNDPGKENEA